MKITIARAVRGATTVLLTGTILVAVAGTSASAAEKNPGGKGGDTKKAESAKGPDEAKAQGAKGSNGANGDCGDYCSTRDGSPSRNGNGGGKASGRPCAGCVGKADDKNPPGQYRNGSDANNGYECDGNSGIARSNPAHTGCTTAPAPVVAPARQGSVAGPVTPVTPVVPAVPAVPAQVLGTRFVRPPGVQPVGQDVTAGTPRVEGAQVLGTRFTQPAVAGRTGSLPRTGGSMGGLVIAALVLLGFGAVVTVTGSGRRRGTV